MIPPTRPTPPLVCLHGWGLHSGIWAALGASLAGHAVLAPDLPGYGHEAPVTPYTAEALAERLAAVVPPACVVLGWSMGGMVALAWAARRPEQVKGLVLVGTSPRFVNGGGWDLGLDPPVLEGFARELGRDYRGTLLRFLALQARGGEAARGVIARLRTTVFQRGEPDPAVLAAGLELLRSVDLRTQVTGVSCPTLVVHGGHDTLCPPAAGRWLAAHLPRARLALHAHAAHAPFLSHPEWFVATLAAFLRRLEASASGPTGWEPEEGGVVGGRAAGRAQAGPAAQR